MEGIKGMEGTDLEIDEAIRHVDETANNND